VTAVIAQPHGVRVMTAGAAKVAPLQEEHQPIAGAIHAGEGQPAADRCGALRWLPPFLATFSSHTGSPHGQRLSVLADEWPSVHSPRHRDRWSAAAILR